MGGVKLLVGGEKPSEHEKNMWLASITMEKTDSLLYDLEKKKKQKNKNHCIPRKYVQREFMFYLDSSRLWVAPPQPHD